MTANTFVLNFNFKKINQQHQTLGLFDLFLKNVTKSQQCMDKNTCILRPENAINKML